MTNGLVSPIRAALQIQSVSERVLGCKTRTRVLRWAEVEHLTGPHERGYRPRIVGHRRAPGPALRGGRRRRRAAHYRREVSRTSRCIAHVPTERHLSDALDRPVLSIRGRGYRTLPGEGRVRHVRRLEFVLRPLVRRRTGRALPDAPPSRRQELRLPVATAGSRSTRPKGRHRRGGGVGSGSRGLRALLAAGRSCRSRSSRP